MCAPQEARNQAENSGGEVVKCLGRAQTMLVEEEKEEDGEETSEKLSRVSGE